MKCEVWTVNRFDFAFSCISRPPRRERQLCTVAMSTDVQIV